MLSGVMKALGHWSFNCFLEGQALLQSENKLKFMGSWRLKAELGTGSRSPFVQVRERERLAP